MNDDPVFQYLKLFLDYVPLWLLAVVIFGIILYRNPALAASLRTHISSIRFGEFEVKLQEVKDRLKETEEHVAEIEEENLRLNQIVDGMDIEGPIENLDGARQALKALSGNIDDLSPVAVALKAGASQDELYAAAEILRSRRDFSFFDDLISAVDRIASSDDLEGNRYRTVWTLASAVHRTVLAAVKHTKDPRLSEEQLSRAQGIMWKLHNNGHVQGDRPDDPKKGIRGPSKHAINWIEKGLAKYDQS